MVDELNNSKIVHSGAIPNSMGDPNISKARALFIWSLHFIEIGAFY